jgi:PAS domain S-box-containing protein
MAATPSKQTVFLALALASLLLVQGVSIWSGREAADAQQRRRQIREVLQSLGGIRECTRLNEACFREYLAGGEEAAADRVGVGLADSRTRRGEARELLRGRAAQLDRLDQLDAALGRVSGTYVRLIDARRAQGAAAASQLAASAGLGQLSQAAESLLDQLEAEEDQLLAQREARGQRLAALTAATTSAGCVLTLFFGLLAWRALRQQSSARAEADAQTVEAVAQFRGLMEHSPDAIWINQNNRVVFANPAFAQLLGHASSHAVLGRSPFEFVRSDFHDLSRAGMKTTEAGQRAAPVELVYVRLDGEQVPVEVNTVPAKFNGQPCVLVVARDLTERKRAEQALAKSVAEFQDLYQNAPCGYHSVDAEGVFVAVNNTELAWFGRTREELVGKKKHRDLVTPDTLAAYDEGFAQFKEHGEVRDLEFKIARADGTVMNVLLNATAVRDKDGRILHSRSTMFDVTRRKQAEEALRASEENLRVTLKSIGDGVLVTDAGGCVTRLNQVAETLTGWTEAEAMGRPVGEVFRVINEHTRQPAEVPVADTLAKGTLHGLANHTVLIARGGVERPIADSCAPILGAAGRVLGAVLVFRDVTEERVAETELRRSRAVLQNLFESLPGLFLVLTPDLKIAAVSDAYLRATMTKREEITGRGLFEIFPDNPDDTAATGVSNLRASLGRVLKHAASDTMAIQKYDVRRPDGVFEERYWSPINSPVFGADHRIEYIIHRVEDVTEFVRRRQQAAPQDAALLTRMEQMEAEIYRSAQEVRAARDELEVRVNERTAELAATNRELVAEIAAREESQRALTAAEAKFRTLVEQSLVGIYVIQDGRYAYVNPRMTEIFGYALEEFTARPVSEYIAEADRDLVETNIRRRLSGEVPSIRYQLTMLRRDRTLVQVEVHGARAEFNGRPAIMGTLLDITERRLAEQRLAAERQLLRTLIDNLPSYIFVKDAQGRYLLSNEAHTRLLGARTEAELMGKTVADFFPPDKARHFTASDEVVMHGGRPLIEQEEAYGAGIEAGWYAATKVPLRDAQGAIIGVVGIKHDITERKQAEEALKFYTASLERSNRELQDFASVASHDLQEPLRKIQAFSDRLKARSGPALDETARDYLDRIQNAAARMQTLVNDLLTFSRVTSRAQPFSPTDLARVAREVLSDLETRLEQTNGRVELGDLPVIEADATQMRQLLQNLIANALKFHRSDAPPVVKVACERDGDFVRLLVADNGIGFDEKYLDRIFTIFQRLHVREQYEGTGVGLAVCRKIAHRHNGTITARSQPGAGATFIVTLPARQVKG